MMMRRRRRSDGGKAWVRIKHGWEDKDTRFKDSSGGWMRGETVDWRNGECPPLTPQTICDLSRRTVIILCACVLLLVSYKDPDTAVFSSVRNTHCVTQSQMNSLNIQYFLVCVCVGPLLCDDFLIVFKDTVWYVMFVLLEICSRSCFILMSFCVFSSCA